MSGMGNRGARRGLQLAAAAIVGLLVALGQPAGALAQSPTKALTKPSSDTSAQGKALAKPMTAKGSQAPVSDLEALAATLEDETARRDFLDKLNALIAARKAVTEPKPKPERPGLMDRMVGALSDQLQALSARVTAVVGVLRDVPRLAPWLERWLGDPGQRARLIDAIWRFLVVVGAGMAVQYGYRRLTGGLRARLEQDAGSTTGTRILRFAGRTVLLYGNALAYGAGAYAAFAAVGPGGIAGQVVLVGAASFFVAKLILATTRVIVAPQVAHLRPVPVTDETAVYLYLWVRRLVRIFVYAFFLLEAARLIGLPAPAYASLQYILGFALLGFLVVFVLQNRAPVAAAIRGEGAAPLYGGFRARLAATWHLFAILYLVAIYLVWLFRLEGGFEFLLFATVLTAVAVGVAKLVILGVNRGIGRLFDISDELETRFPGLKERVNRYVPVLTGTLRWIVYACALLVILDIWGIDTLAWLASPQGASALEKLVIIAFIVAASVVVWEVISLAIERYLRQLEGRATGAARARTLLPLMRTTAAIVIAVLATLIVLSELGVNIGPLLAGAGVVGLAIGFGSQKLVQDVITGLFILIEDTIAVGDVVQFDSTHSGLVEAITIRSVRLRDLSGNVHVLPFSEVKTTLNMTKEFGFYLADVGIAYREDVDRVTDVLGEIVEEMRADERYARYMPEPLEVLGLDKFGDSAVVIRVRIKVIPPINRWMVGREFNRRMKIRFDKEGIEIPFPHRTLYFGVDQQGNAPPALVRLMDERAKAAAPPAGAKAASAGQSPEAERNRRGLRPGDDPGDVGSD